MNSKLLTGAAAMLLGRSRRFRWLIPAVPLAVAAYRFYKQRAVRQIATVAPQDAHVIETALPEPVATSPELSPVLPPPVRRRKRTSTRGRTASR